MSIPPRIKICCISSVAEAQLAIRYGASALGLVSEMPSGPGVISIEKIAEIAATIPPPIASFLLTSRCSADAILEQHHICKTNTIQLVDHVPIAELLKLRAQLPAIKLVQVIHVIDQASIDEAREIANYVDALLLDSGNPTLSVKELGGTGRVHDWSISRQIKAAVNLPIFLAGGLKEENVREAIQQVAPFGLDLCSSVREGGQLSEDKLRRFMHAASNK